MSIPSQAEKKPIESKRELVEWFEKGSTPANRLLIGVEHEKPPFYLDTKEPVPFLGEGTRKGIKDFIDKMVAERGWNAGEPENGCIVDIWKNNRGWTFEPGLQMETGGAPLRNVHQNARETEDTIREALDVTTSLGYGLLAQGYHPLYRAKDLPFMPKTRYQALSEWFEHKMWPNAQDVASCTSTVQVNMGYQSEEDMVKMLRVSLSLQPVVVAMFANSPFSEGQLTGYQSFRSHKLYNNLGGRYGFMLPIAFEDDFGFEKFTDYALNTMPLLGIYKGNVFHDAKGATFGDFMEGNLSICPGQRATISDWQNHLNTIWPEVRLRRFLEMRGADNGPQEMIKALPAFWVGLLYDKTSLDAAYDMVRDWTDQDRDYLRVMTPQHGMQTKFLGTTVQDIAQNCLAMASEGLRRRAVPDDNGNDERQYLQPLHEIASSGRNWAQRLERRFRKVWKGDIRQLFNEMSYAAEPTVLKPEPKPVRVRSRPAKRTTTAARKGRARD